MEISYKILFTIALLHEYKANGKSTYFDVVPADDCLALFRGLNIAWRQLENRFVALIQENGQNEPFLNSASATPPQKRYVQENKARIFRLYLKLKDPYFLNFTNIDMDTALPAARRLLVGNLAANKSGETLYLSRKIDAVDTGKDYLPGALVLEAGTSKVYEALQQQAAGAVRPLSDGDFWELKAEKQYPVPEKDSIEVCGGSYRFSLPAPVRQAALSLYTFNFDNTTPDFNVLVLESTLVFEEPESVIQVSFAGLSPGKYKVRVNGENRFVYYDPALVRNDFFGVIEIYNHLDGGDAYALLDPDEKIRQVAYTLQFANRRVLWKYTRKTDKAVRLEDAAGRYVFNLTGNDFVSKKPLPLCETASPTLSLHFNNPDANYPVSPLPVPSGKTLTRHEQDGFNYLCSAMFLSH